MIKKSLALFAGALALASCTDSVPPSSPVAALRAPTLHTEQVTISGPTLRGNGQTGNWSVPSFPGTTFHWKVQGQIGYIAMFTQSVSYSSSSSFTLEAWGASQSEHEYTHYGSLFVEVWPDCNPDITNGNDPMYCDAEILGSGAAERNQLCVWEADTNMPPATTEVNWYVNDVWQHTGLTFEYSHSSYGSFNLYMTAENLSFGARDDSKTVTVGQGLTCLE